MPVAGRVFDAEDMQSLMDAALDFWLTTGRFAAQFEKAFARYLRRPHRDPGELRLLRQSAGPDGAHLARSSATGS